MKKQIAILLMLVLTLSLFSGCKKQDEVKEILVGGLSYTNFDDQKDQESIEKIFNEWGKSTFVARNDKKYKLVQKNYDNLATLTMALRKGDIKAITTTYCTGAYIVAKNDDMQLFDYKDKVFTGYAFMFKKGNEELRDRFSEAFQSLCSSGQMRALVTEYVVEADYNEEIAATTMPSFPDAETIKVAITGDLPPLDYIDGNGNPSGFNTAVLAKIAELLKVNIEFVSIDSASRAIALTTGKADVAFWTRSNPVERLVTDYYNETNYDFSRSTFATTFDLPDGVIVSDTYYTDYNVMIVMK